MKALNVKTLMCAMTVCTFCLPVFAQSIKRSLPKSKNELVVIAHRGSHLIKPENTIASIKDAIDIGADYVEIDLRTTRDGHLVLLHNETVDQLTNGKGRIGELDFTEVEKLVLKGRDSSLHHIATFEEALEVCKGKINIYLDFKSASAKDAYTAIKAAGMEEQILVYVNGDEHHLAWSKIAPQMPLISRLDKTINTKMQLLESMERMHLEAIDNVPSVDLFSIVRKLGVSVFLDVQNSSESESDWNNALQKGIQGLQTDHPKTLIEYLKRNKLRNSL